MQSEAGVTLWLVYLSPDQAAWVPVLTGDIAFKITVIVPLTTQAGVLLMFLEGGQLVNSHWVNLVVKTELL